MVVVVVVVNCLAVQNNNKTEYVSVVTLCTNPPQFYNGLGPTPNEASDTAAIDALQKLSEVGLEGLCGQGVAGLSVTESSPRLVANCNLPLVTIHSVCRVDPSHFWKSPHY